MKIEQKIFTDKEYYFLKKEMKEDLKRIEKGGLD
jgi:hypothetical protein